MKKKLFLFRFYVEFEVYAKNSISAYADLESQLNLTAISSADWEVTAIEDENGDELPLPEDGV